MDWSINDEKYVPRKDCRGIIYKMSYDGKHYYGKKVIISPKKVPVNYDKYYGSSTKWKEYIKGYEADVKREVIYECINKSEMYYYECKIIIDNNALFDPDCYNGNLNMVTTKAHVKNFFNKP